jgi:hypothetical protein
MPPLLVPTQATRWLAAAIEPSAMRGFASGSRHERPPSVVRRMPGGAMATPSVSSNIAIDVMTFVGRSYISRHPPASARTPGSTPKTMPATAMTTACHPRVMKVKRHSRPSG